MNVHELLIALRRRILIPVLLGVLGAAGLYYYGTSRPAHYTANAQMMALVRGAESPGDLAAGANYMKLQVVSYSQIASSPTVLRRVVDDLDLKMSEADLAAMVTMDVPVNTTWLNLSVTSGDPELSADIATSLSSAFVDEVENIEARGRIESPVRIDIVDPATVPLAPDTSDAVKYAVVGGLGGFLLGLLLALFLSARKVTRSQAEGSRRAEVTTRSKRFGGVQTEGSAVEHADPGPQR